MRAAPTASWAAAAALLAMAFSARAEDSMGDGGAMPSVTIVSNADMLQSALSMNHPFIRITEHLDLRNLHYGTPEQGTLVFPPGYQQTVIWGECTDVPPPTLDRFTRVINDKKSNKTRSYGGCGLYSSLPTAHPDPRHAIISLPRDSKLLLSNLLIHTAFDNSTSEEKHNVGIATDSAELWTMEVLFAGFSQAGVSALDSQVYMINSWNYQAGFGRSGPESAVDFLVQADSDLPFKLILSGTIFHADFLNQFTPIYVGRVDNLDGTNASIIHGSSLTIRGNPWVVTHNSLQHLHYADGQYSEPGTPLSATRGNCTGICIWSTSSSQVLLFLNNTVPTEKLDPQYTQFQAQYPNGQGQVYRDVHDLDWTAVVDDETEHQQWVEDLAQAGVHGTDILWNPFTRTGMPAPPNATSADPPPSSGSKSSIGPIIGGVIGALLLLALVIGVSVYCYHVRRNKRANAAATAKGAAHQQKPDDATAVTVNKALGLPSDSESNDSGSGKNPKQTARAPTSAAKRTPTPEAPAQEKSSPPLPPPSENPSCAVSVNSPHSSSAHDTSSYRGPPGFIPPLQPMHEHMPPMHAHPPMHPHAGLYPGVYYAPHFPEPYLYDAPPDPHALYGVQSNASSQSGKHLHGDSHSDSGSSTVGNLPHSNRPRLAPQLMHNIYAIPARPRVPRARAAAVPLSLPSKVSTTSESAREPLSPTPVSQQDPTDNWTKFLPGSMLGTTQTLTTTRTTQSACSENSCDDIMLAENVVPTSQLSQFEVLDRQLDAFDTGKGGPLLLNRYRLQGGGKRRYGGQGVVAFGKPVYNSKKKVAIKFFLSRSAFDTEQKLYLDRRLHKMLPPVDEIITNEDNSVRDPNGRPLPPFVIMEKGESLNEHSSRNQPNFASCMQIIMHIAERVVELHSFNLVHSDLKPSNCIWLPSRNEWTIIDFGSSAIVGSTMPLSISFGYSPPEVVEAHLRRDKTITASFAVDVWSIAVIGWELLTNTVAFPKGSGLYEAVTRSVTDGVLFPWEDEAAPQYKANMRALGFMREGLLLMLQRDPAKRPVLRDVVNMFRRALQQETMATMGKDDANSEGSSPTVEPVVPA